MKYLTIFLLILYSCSNEPKINNRPLVTQKFVIYYPGYPDTLTFESKNSLYIHIFQGCSQIKDVEDVLFKTTAPIKKLN